MAHLHIRSGSKSFASDALNRRHSIVQRHSKLGLRYLAVCTKNTGTPCVPKIRARRCGRHICNARAAPELTDATSIPKQRPPSPPPPQWGLSLQKVIRSVEKSLSNLQLAIAQLAVLAFLSSLGTVIEQEQTLKWYMENYPDGPRKVLGFLDYNTLFLLQLDHIYTSFYFLGISALLAASLIACSRTQQWPLVKMARRWRFAKTAQQVFAKGNGETLPQARSRDFGAILAKRGYAVFLSGERLYGFKGIAGRFAPIAVHVSLIMILGGCAFGALAGFEGQVMLAEGREFLVADVLRSADTALAGLPLPAGASKVLRLEKFDIDYRSDGSISQYRSVLSQRSLSGTLEREKEIYVNEPLRFGGVTIYQTDWSLSAIKFRVGPSPDPDAFSPPVASRLAEVGSALGMNAKNKLYGTFVPLEIPQEGKVPRGLSILAKDLQSVVFYDAEGSFVGVRRPGSGKPIQVEGQYFIVDELVGASGMQLKHDPGVIYVYTGFGLLMVTTIVSYISHSQVWALQDGSDLHVGGMSNRAKVGFEAELGQMLGEVPELQPSQRPGTGSSV